MASEQEDTDLSEGEIRSPRSANDIENVETLSKINATENDTSQNDDSQSDLFHNDSETNKLQNDTATENYSSQNDSLNSSTASLNSSSGNKSVLSKQQAKKRLQAFSSAKSYLPTSSNHKYPSKQTNAVEYLEEFDEDGVIIHTVKPIKKPPKRGKFK